MYVLISTVIIIVSVIALLLCEFRKSRRKLDRMERFCLLGDIEGKNMLQIVEFVGEPTKVRKVKDGYLYTWSTVSIFEQYQVSLFCDENYVCRRVVMDFGK